MNRVAGQSLLFLGSLGPEQEKIYVQPDLGDLGTSQDPLCSFSPRCERQGLNEGQRNVGQGLDACVNQVVRVCSFFLPSHAATSCGRNVGHEPVQDKPSCLDSDYQSSMVREAFGHRLLASGNGSLPNHGRVQVCLEQSVEESVGSRHHRATLEAATRQSMASLSAYVPADSLIHLASVCAFETLREGRSGDWKSQDLSEFSQVIIYTDGSAKSEVASWAMALLVALA